MKNVKKILISDTNYPPAKMYLDQMPKLTKGFIRLGNDVRHINYCGLLKQLSPFKSRSLSQFFYKKKVDELTAMQVRSYKPDIIYINFARSMDGHTIDMMRQEAGSAVFIGGDGDPWPKLQKDNRIETARGLDIMTATNDGEFLQDYRDAGVKNCIFLPNICDPDTDHRYDVGDQWKTDILWTGKIGHNADTSNTFRRQLIEKIEKRKNSSVYGCLGHPKIGGLDYFYAISGAKIGVNINAYGPVKFCHSDRLTQYLACGTFVMAKRFDGCNLLYKDNIHLRYFDTLEEFAELANWYLEHEDERKKIADTGMKWAHEQFNCLKIASYILELVEKGTYSSPWAVTM